MEHKEKQLAILNEVLDYTNLLKESVNENQKTANICSEKIILSLAKLVHLQNGMKGIEYLKEILNKM